VALARLGLGGGGGGGSDDDEEEDEQNQDKGGGGSGGGGLPFAPSPVPERDPFNPPSSSSSDSNGSDDSGSSGGGSDGSGSSDSGGNLSNSSAVKKAVEQANVSPEPEEPEPDQGARDDRAAATTGVGSGGSSGSGGPSDSKQDSGGDSGRSLDVQESEPLEPDDSNTDGEDSSSGGVLSGIKESASDAVDDAAEGALDATGIEEYATSEAAAKARAEIQAAEDEGGATGAAKKFDTLASTGFDFLLDNPSASAQEAAQGGASAVTGVDEDNLGEAAADAAGATEAAVRDAVDGTALDNPVTDAAKGAMDVFIAEPAKAALTAGTGIDIDKGTTEGQVGAVDAADIGLTIGTAGIGKAGLGAGKAALKGSDEAATVVGKALGKSDEAAEAATKAADDAASAGDDAVAATDGGTDVFNPATDAAAGSDDAATAAADDATQEIGERGARTFSVLDDGAAGVSDEAGESAFRSALRSSDEAAQAGDDAATLGDDALSLSDEAAAASDDAASAADDVGEAAAKSGDETPSWLDETISLSDEGAQVADDAGDSALKRAVGTRTGKAAAGAGGALAGGALLDSLGAFDTLEVEDPQTGETYRLSNEKSYPPTEQRPNGGALWQVQRGSNKAGWSGDGYTIIVGASGRNVYILDSNGNRTRAQLSVQQFRQAIQRGRGGGA